jgi:hypothetical protein
VLTRRVDEVISRYYEEEQRRQRRKGPGICRQDWRVRALVLVKKEGVTVHALAVFAWLGTVTPKQEG